MTEIQIIYDQTYKDPCQIDEETYQSISVLKIAGTPDGFILMDIFRANSKYNGVLQSDAFYGINKDLRTYLSMHWSSRGKKGCLTADPELPNIARQVHET